MSNIDFVDVGKRIKKKRKDKGYSQAALAENLGLNVKTIIEWEKGNMNGKIDFPSFLELCNVLEIDMPFLLGNDYDTKEIESICKYTGLSQKTVKKLHSDVLMDVHYSGKMLSYFLDTYQEFPDLLMQIESYFVSRKKYDDICSQMTESSIANKDFRDLMNTGYLQKQVNGDLYGCLSYIVDMYQVAKYEEKIYAEIYN